MRPLPRLHAVTVAAIITRDDFSPRIAAIAATGSAVALHARDPHGSGRQLAALTQRLLSHARPAEASVFVNARPDVAAALGAHGVQLPLTSLSAADARTVFLHRGAAPDGWGTTWIGVSVHSLAEAEQAITEGADYLMVGNIYETPTHPGRPGAGLALLRDTIRLGKPVIAIGGITAQRVAEVRRAGAWGVAAVSALWLAPNPALAARELLAPWSEDA